SRLGFGLQGNSTDRTSPEAIVLDRRCCGDVLLFFCHSRTNFISLSLCPAMKILATIVIALVVLGSALLFLLSSICAVAMIPTVGSAIGGVMAVISLAVMFGGIVLMAKINKEEASPTTVTREESVTTSKSQVDENK